MKHRRGMILAGIILLLAILITVFIRFPTAPQTQLAFTSEPQYTETVTPTCSPTLQRISDYAQQQGYTLEDYPQSLIDLLERNPETEKFVLEYPKYKDTAFEIDLSDYTCDSVPLFMQWDQQWGYIPYGSDVAGLTACGPVCLSMAAYYLTGSMEYSPDKMIKFSQNNGYCTPGDGTSWTLISEGAELLGFDVTEIPLDKTRILDNLEAGNPIICVVGPGDFTTSGHYILLSGCKDGKIQINDPNSYKNSRKLWTYEEISPQIENLWVIRTV